MGFTMYSRAPRSKVCCTSVGLDETLKITTGMSLRGLRSNTTCPENLGIFRSRITSAVKVGIGEKHQRLFTVAREGKPDGIGEFCQDLTHE
jgi:hypothetical protein